MRQYYLGLLLLLQDLALSNADPAQKVLANDKTKLKEKPVDIAQTGERVAQDGDKFVADALSLLRSEKKPAKRIRKQQGLTNTLWSLVLKTVPTIRLSEPPAETASTPKSGLSRALQDATTLLETAAGRNNSDALYILAEMNLYGNYSHPRNFKSAFNYYSQLASLNGNSSAQYMVGLMYSTGVGGAVEPDQARALLYYTFAAEQGHTRAEMTLAHRHQAGIATPKSCEMATKYYKRVADKAMAWHRSGPPGGMGWVTESYRIADETGGVYGEGASVSSAGVNAIKAHPNSDAYASIEDIIEYLNLMSEKGDFKASFNLGRIFYEGQRGLPKNMAEAKRYFSEVTQKYWGKNGKPVPAPKPSLDKTAAKAAGFLGRMYMRGEGVEQNFDRAKAWFERGTYLKDAQSQHGLGLLYLHGYGVKRDVATATDYFKAASSQDYPHSQVQLGALYLDQGGPDDIPSANHYFELAARWSNIEAYYYLAELNYLGVGREKSCSTALGYFKIVAERAEPFVSSWAEANLAYDDGDTELALLEYLGAAEQGYEKAQNNVAHILDPDQSSLPIPEWLHKPAPKPELLNNPRLALMYWTRSARQGNVDSLVKMGDYYLSGIGAEPDVDKAVQCYQGASEYQQSAQAMYNLGWMYENGIGLDQDFHLAKRHYDSALEINEEARLPVTLSLLKLRVRSAWNTLTHGSVNSIRDEPDILENKQWSLSDWITNFLRDDGGQLYDEYYDDYYDDGGMPGGDDPHFEDDEDGLIESAVIIGLVAALAFLLVYRNQRQQRRQEQEAAELNAQAQGGQHQAQQGAQQPVPPPRFPEPGDPDFWNRAPVVGPGGVGH
ncbi:protein sel-1 1 [Podospora fimiseda]|uniref:Protein sel-1 1 n=1 Tax=Podospora fimiseda TaxID=252190 RepID=A0AAN7BXB3_9PEZI|nr:protein sel-1 1 [Podospora fimiseda]